MNDIVSLQGWELDDEHTAESLMGLGSWFSIYGRCRDTHERDRDRYPTS